MKTRIAFAGIGGIARVHAHAAQVAGAELVAAVNHRPESLAAFAADFGISRQYASIEAMIADGNVDAVVVSTPNHLHAPQTIAALSAGLHVIVEKPMALNGGECAAMVAAGQRSGAMLMVAHNWRFEPEVVWLREQVVAGKLGPIIRTKGYGVHVNWGPDGWFTQKKYAGGGAMADMGVHAIDTARFLMGDPQPVSVFARIGTYYKDFDVDDTGVMLVNWDNGAVSYLESGWWQPHSDGVEAGTQLYGRAGLGQLFPTGLRPLGTNAVQPAFSSPRAEGANEKMYNAQLAYFLDCIDKGRRPAPSGEDGWANIKVVDAAYESARTGQVVPVA